MKNSVMKMKVHNWFIPIYVCIIISLTSSCVPMGNPTFRENGCVLLIKFYEPSNKNKILAYINGRDGVEETTGSSDAYMMRFNVCVAHPHNHFAPKWTYPFPESNHSPYWELPNDWLLIDWRWTGFPYSQASSVIIDKTWEELYDSSWVWQRELVIDEYPIAGWKYVNIENMALQINKEYDEDVLFLINNIHNTGSYLGENVHRHDFCLCEVPNMMDSIWGILQTDLSTYIKSGGLNSKR